MAAVGCCAGAACKSCEYLSLSVIVVICLIPAMRIGLFLVVAMSVSLEAIE